MFSSVARSCRPILCKARGSERGRQSSARLASARPGPAAAPTYPHGRTACPRPPHYRGHSTPSRLSREQSRVSSHSCVFLVVGCCVGFVCCLLLLVFFHLHGVALCPQPSWRPPPGALSRAEADTEAEAALDQDGARRRGPSLARPISAPPTSGPAGRGGGCGDEGGTGRVAGKRGRRVGRALGVLVERTHRACDEGKQEVLAQL
ncbi:uncharacterized protein [Patagioenas fasciata]|uniref:uncharacterized protein n=1 Tax=Patagioenas fasciata TaxID=372321 RepID=UPI003A98DF20